jgi:predicted MFS family arabinose efflux permease
MSTTRNINRWRAFALLAVAYFMTIIDLTIVNVSLPTIGRDLHFSETNLQWVVTAYALTFGGCLLLGGRAADLLGRRRILMLGLSVFTAASLACALATGEAFLIGSRAVQGLGAAIMLPAALSIVMNMFAEGAERNKALGIWGRARSRRRDRRADHRRASHPLRRVAVHLLSERPDWSGRAGAVSLDRPRQPAYDQPPAV